VTDCRQLNISGRVTQGHLAVEPGTLFQLHRRETRMHPGHGHHFDGSEQTCAQEVAANILKAVQQRGLAICLPCPAAAASGSAVPRAAEAHRLSEPPPRLTYTQGIRGRQTSQSMAQTLLLLHSAGLGNRLQPMSSNGGLIPVPCNQKKAYSTISIQISRPNHMTV